MNAYREEQLLQTAISGLPSQAPRTMWITEYNIRAGHGKTNPPQETNAHGLFVGQDALLLLQTPETALTNFFSAFGEGGLRSLAGLPTSP